MISFITGSHAYGTPTDASDIDLVVLVTKEEKEFLFSKSDITTKVMFGKLNLIVLDASYDEDLKKYHAWREGNEYLKSIKPVTRDFAIKHFETLGIKKKEYDDTTETLELIVNSDFQPYINVDEIDNLF